MGLMGNPVKIWSGPAAVIPIPILSELNLLLKEATRWEDGEGRQRPGEPEDLPGLDLTGQPSRKEVVRVKVFCFYPPGFLKRRPGVFY